MCLASRTIVAALACHSLLAWPASMPARANPPPAAAGDRSAAEQEGVLLLRNRNVIQGTIRRVGDHYHVAVPGGSLLVRAADVQLAARNVDEIYRLLTAAIPADSADGHLHLAVWCLRNHLLGYAAREIMSAQDIEPNHPGLRQMEHLLKSAVLAPTQSKPSTDLAGVAPPATAGTKPRTAEGRPRGAPRKRRAVGKHRPPASHRQPVPETGPHQLPSASGNPPATPATDAPGRTDEAPRDEPPAEPGAKDPFDPEIFNRQHTAARPPADA